MISLYFNYFYNLLYAIYVQFVKLTYDWLHRLLGLCCTYENGPCAIKRRQIGGSARLPQPLHV